jgi:hypothetical protein
LAGHLSPTFNFFSFSYPLSAKRCTLFLSFFAIKTYTGASLFTEQFKKTTNSDEKMKGDKNEKFKIYLDIGGFDLFSIGLWS